MAVTIRTLTAAEWPVWRDVTLQSLAESPDAFRPTLAEVDDEPDEFWQEMVGPTAEHDRFNLWIATFDGADVGKAFARIDEAYTTVYIGAMWVAPQARRQGIGDALVAAVLAWGDENDTTTAELWVTEANAAAVRFYESQGFEPTDDTDVLREESDLIVRKLVRRMRV